MSLRPLTDETLLVRLETLVHQERESVAEIVEHLAEVDRRDIVLDRGYATLFEYCTKRLRYSEAAAFLRIRAARAAKQFPRVLDDLKSGAIHLDAIMRLYPHLDARNCDRLLAQAAGASKREVLALVSSLGGAGGAPERDVIRRLPVLPPATSPSARDAQPPPGIALPSAGAAFPPAGAALPPVAMARRQDPDGSVGTQTVLAPSRIRLSFTADDGFLAMVERLRRLRRHKYPAGRLEDLLKDAVASILARIDPERLKQDRRRGRGAAKPRSRAPSRRVPAAVKAEVWKRDGGRCAYVAPDGRRCEGRDFLEFDHAIPWAIGGKSDNAANIRLLCRPHNQMLARRRFGPRRIAAP
ncbi:MAG: HNH endonuclease [Elusimicrobia bacterium]|nr:HNH endonuclease [Elusimicrobiota bacterium]